MKTFHGWLLLVKMPWIPLHSGPAGHLVTSPMILTSHSLKGTSNRDLVTRLSKIVQYSLTNETLKSQHRKEAIQF